MEKLARSWGNDAVKLAFLDGESMEELKKERAALAAEGECANEPDEQSE